jgi:carotenoid cleavage dioxygenase-like enzyme
MTATALNPYLAGNFTPIREEISADSLEIIGKLPPDLSGMFIRNGANPQFPPIGNYHWFDGDGMLHGVLIQNAKASYRNRFVRTKGWQIENELGKAIWTGLLEPPQIDNPYGLIKNTSNTALVWHAKQLLSLWEAGAPHAIQLPELETIGIQDYQGKLTSGFTAHPKVDPVTGEMIFFGYSLRTPPYLQYGIVAPTGELLKIMPIDLPAGSLMHDFAITEHYTIFMDFPLTFRAERMTQGKPSLIFESDRPSRFGIIPRHGDHESIRWFESPACYVTHTLNAYEEGDEIVLIGCRMSSTVLWLSEQPDDPEVDIPRLYQWRFNLKTGEVKEEMLDATPSEFPRINEQLLGQKTRYGYAVRRTNTPEILFDGLIKYDFNNGNSEILEFAPGCYGGDVVFVPRPEATAEDDGWLLTLVHDEKLETSQLLIVNAQAINSEPVARIIIPQRVPYGFHAIWVERSQFA